MSSHAVGSSALFLWRIWLFRQCCSSRCGACGCNSRPELGMDTMVMDNDEAPQRHGLMAPAERPVKGFQPLRLPGSACLIDAVFRGGDKHSNHADTALQDPESSDSEASPKVPPTSIIVRLQRLFRSEAAAGLGDIEVGTLSSASYYGDVQQYILQGWEVSAWGVSPRRSDGIYVAGRPAGQLGKFRRALFAGRLMEPAAPFGLCPYGSDPVHQSVAAAPWTSSSGRAAAALASKRKPFCKAIMGKGADELVHRP